MKWYWWALLAVAVLLTIYVVAVAVMNNPKKIEKAVTNSNPDNLETSKSSTYNNLGRIADKISVEELSAGTKVVKTTKDRRPGYSACGHFISVNDLNNDWDGDVTAWKNKVCYGKVTSK